MTESTTQPILKPKPFFSRGFGRKTGSFKWFFLTILLVGPFFIFLSGALGHHAALSPIHLNPGEISFQPEMERDLEDCVIGLNPDQERRYLLPDLEIPGRLPEAQYQVIRRQLFWLDFELCHGKLLMSLPAYTRIYVALPEPQNQLGGDEKEFFLEYLKSRCGWTDAELRWRVYFFKTPQPMVWTQDIGKIVGRDDQGRWVILRGPADQEPYRQTVAALCQAYPDRYTYRDLPKGVSAEGGDEDLIRTPNGQLAFLAGRHRAETYLKWMKGTPPAGSGVQEKDLQRVQNDFSAAIGHMPVFFLPDEALRNPSLGNPELFHLDMLAAVLGSPASTRAFIPTYLPSPKDRVTGRPLTESFVRSLQGEYNLAASQLGALGYQVVRLPLDDHPVRSPVNVVRFYDPADRRFKLLVAKYPPQGLDVSHPGSQEALRQKLDHLGKTCTRWEEAPNSESYQALSKSLEQLWKEMDESASAPNPLFDQWSELFSNAGYDVIPVPDYAWGAGGLHCQLLH